MDLSSLTLRVLRAVSERGSFTAAASALGYTQSAVSRQIAAAEAETGARLFDRVPSGVRLTAQGKVLLNGAVIALDALDRAEQELHGAPVDVPHVRVGVFPAVAAVLLPRLVRLLAEEGDPVRLASREGTTPELTRALRSGSIDLAVVSVRPPFRALDQESPRLTVRTLTEVRLALAVPAGGRFGGRTSVTLDELRGQPWIGSPTVRNEPLLGVWPGLPEAAEVRHTARDWLTKLRLVAAGAGITTVTEDVAHLVPGVHLTRIEGVAEEVRRIVLARRPGPPIPGAARVATAWQTVAQQISG